MKRLFNFILLFALVAGLCTFFRVPVMAQEEEQDAKEISGTALVTDHSGFQGLRYLFDGDVWEGMKTEKTAHLTLEHDDGIGSLYLIFRKPYGEYTITNNDTGAVFTAGTDLFIHEFVDLTQCFSEAPKSITISFDNGQARLYELEVYTEGRVPDSVQMWNHPVEHETDLILFATHSDDDQLFFAGLLPYYAVERGYQVQVVYLTNHYNSGPFRIHEMLNGLWAVGIKTYPIFGAYQDFGDTSTLEGAFRKFEKQGHTREAMTGFVVEQLRRFKPQVAVGHDLKGEYGHAQHLVFAQLVIDAVELSANAEYYPETAQQYGVWDVPKTYIHLYPENPIVMDWDQPMENFDGMTPFEVSKKLGFPAHKSQQKGWSWYYKGKNAATEIEKYSPCEYGLYRTTVGPDAEKNDMFENLNSYAEQAAILAEAQRLEAERLEAERLEAERLAEEKRLAEEAAKEAAKAESEAAAQTQPYEPAQTDAPTVPAAPIAPPAEEKSMAPWLILEGVLAAILVVLLLVLKRRRHR